MNGMTSGERLELGKLLRLRGKVAKDDLKARGAEHLAVIEQQLSARYLANDPVWAELTAAAEAAVQQADAEIAKLCKERGIPAEFRPRLSLAWYGRGENAAKDRRAELRTLAKAEIDAGVKRASVEVDRSVADLQTKLINSAMRSEEARRFLDALPSIDALLPAPSLEAIEKIAATRPATHWLLEG